MSAAGAFALHTTAGGEHELLTVSGEVDLGSAEDFERSVAAACARGPTVLDMSAVVYFDSAAFAALERLRARWALVVLLGAGAVIARAAEIVGLPFFDDATAAGEAALAAGARAGT